MGDIISNEKVETYSGASACQLMQDVGTKYSLPDIWNPKPIYLF